MCYFWLHLKILNTSINQSVLWLCFLKLLCRAFISNPWVMFPFAASVCGFSGWKHKHMMCVFWGCFCVRASNPQAARSLRIYVLWSAACSWSMAEGEKEGEKGGEREGWWRCGRSEKGVKGGGEGSRRAKVQPKLADWSSKVERWNPPPD